MTGVRTTRSASSPWGSIAALLAACFATIVGLIRDIDPDVILWRAIVAATVVGAVVAVTNGVAQLNRSKPSDK